MKAISAKATAGLNIGAWVNTADNSGAKIVKIVGVKRKLLYILLSIIILPLVFYLYLCEKRYVLISLAISLFGLFLNKYFNVK